MSLVPTFARAVDGVFYENPVLRGDGWFLCFDDDDPPELVIRTVHHAGFGGKAFREKVRARAVEILDGLGFRYRITSKEPHCTGQRLFGENRQFNPAAAFFLKIESPIPVPQQFSGKATLEEVSQRECVVYTFEEV